MSIRSVETAGSQAACNPPSLLQHSGPVAVGLVPLGLATLIAGRHDVERREGGGYLAAATVALLLPFNVRQAVMYPTAGSVLLATANLAMLAD